MTGLPADCDVIIDQLSYDDFHKTKKEFTGMTTMK